MFQFFLLIGLFGKVFGFVGIGLVVVEFAGLHLARHSVAPLDVAVALGADGIAHDIAVFAVAGALEGTWVLAKNSSFPWTIGFLK